MKNTEPSNLISKNHGRINNDSRRPKPSQPIASSGRKSVGRAKAHAASVGAGNKRTERKNASASAADPAAKRAGKKAPHILQVKLGRERGGKHTLQFLGIGAKVFLGFIRNVAAMAGCSPDVAMNVWLSLKIATLPTVAEIREMEVGE